MSTVQMYPSLVTRFGQGLAGVASNLEVALHLALEFVAIILLRPHPTAHTDDISEPTRPALEPPQQISGLLSAEVVIQKFLRAQVFDIPHMNILVRQQAYQISPLFLCIRPNRLSSYHAGLRAHMFQTASHGPSQV